MINTQVTSNYATLSGKIVSLPQFSHEVYGEKFYEILLEVKRLSQSVDIVPVSLSERLMCDSLIELGNEITVTGQFRSYNKTVEDKSKLMLTVFARDIVPLTSDINPNSIQLEGYICKLPVFRTTPFNREICDVLLAVNRQYNKSDYIPCIAWGRNARFVRSLPVGEHIRIIGRIQSRQYQKKLDDDVVVTRTAYEVSINKIELLDRYALSVATNATEFYSDQQ
ncbi:MAG TPA: single-stranded DNA-binding protein [Candidatus Limihabitans stercoravium]|nr:single-stranded DNA-binding protein [Candidatus Limihabitans stercoravium]